MGLGCPKRLAVPLRGAAVLAGSRGCVGRSLRVRARTLARCMEGLASAARWRWAPTRYLTLHISIYKYSTSCLQPERQPARELETQDSSGPLWMSRGRDGYGFCFRYFHEKESTGLRYNYDV